MADKQEPMPIWIKQTRLPESTKQYFYELWLAGEISPKAPAQDWGAITDVADAIRKLTFKKPKIRSDTFPKQSLEQIQQTASEIAQRRNDLRLAISETDGVDVVLGDETLTLDEAIKQEQNLTIVNNQYKNAIDRRRPSSERAKDPDSNLQVALETAQSNADSAYAEMLQEITAFPETSQPYRDRYFASLKILGQAETKALDKGLTIPKTVTVEMGLPTRDIAAPPTTAGALKKPVATKAPSGVAVQQNAGVTAVTPVEDRAEQARFGRMKTGELRPGVKITEVAEEEPPPTGGAPAVVPTVVITKAQVDKKLVELGLPDTPENRKIARQELKKPSALIPIPPAVVGPDTSWEPIFKQNYPQYNWMFTDLDRTKYADVFSLFARASKTKMTDQEFDRQFTGTSWYTELATSKKGRELSSAIGNFNWGSGQLAKFLTKAYNYGYEGDNLKQQAYTELFSKVNGKYVNDLAVTEVRASSPYLALKKIGTQYLTALTDDTIETALKGGKTADDLLRTSRAQAIAMYPHLKDSLNAGVTLEDLAENYKQIAARTLELDPSQVDMGLKFNEALNYTKDGASRMLSLAEWETELRTNDKYKYSFTKQANQDATSIGLAIARAFGKVQ